MGELNSWKVVISSLKSGKPSPCLEESRADEIGQIKVLVNKIVQCQCWKKCCWSAVLSYNYMYQNSLLISKIGNSKSIVVFIKIIIEIKPGWLAASRLLFVLNPDVSMPLYIRVTSLSTSQTFLTPHGFSLLWFSQEIQRSFDSPKQTDDDSSHSRKYEFLEQLQVRKVEQLQELAAKSWSYNHWASRDLTVIKYHN